MKLALGSAQFGLNYGLSNQTGMVKIDEVANILKLGYQNKILTLDTAPSYGNSESVLGSLLESQPYQIITKIPKINDSPGMLPYIFNHSLSSLSREKIYGVLLHHADDLLTEHGDLLFKLLQNLKKNSLVEKIGVSVYTPRQLQLIMERYDIDLVQLPLNVFDQRFLESDILMDAKKQDIEIHVRSVFLQGLLLMEPNSLPEYLQNAYQPLSKFRLTCQEKEMTQLFLALQFVLQMEYVDKIIVGVTSCQELNGILSVARSSEKLNLDWDLFKVNNEMITVPINWNQELIQ